MPNISPNIYDINWIQNEAPDVMFTTFWIINLDYLSQNPKIFVQEAKSDKYSDSMFAILEETLNRQEKLLLNDGIIKWIEKAIQIHKNWDSNLN